MDATATQADFFTKLRAPEVLEGAVADVVGNVGGVVSGLFNEPQPALARRRRPRHGEE